LFDECYDFPRAEMFFVLLVECALKLLSMEGLCNRKFESSDRLFFYMSRMTLEESTRYCNMLLERSFKILLKSRWHWRRVFLAIDYNDIEYSGEDPLMVFDAMMMRGIQYQHVKVLRYATIAIVAPRFKFTLAVIPVSVLDKPETVVERLLGMVPPVLRVKGVLMDKGFYNANVFKTMDCMGVDYLVPAKKVEALNLTYRIAEVTEKWYWKHVMNRGRANEYTTTVYLRENGLDDYMGMVTNKDMKGMDAELLFKAYRLRWNIENSYKEAQSYRAKTNTRNHAYRILIYAISHLLVNLQILAKRIGRATITRDDMKLVIKLLLTLKHTTIRLTKKLVVTT
jgi:IS4 transposase